MFAGQPLQFWLIIFVFPMLATIPVTTLLCWYRTTQKKRVSYGTVAAGACFLPLLLFLFYATAIWWSGTEAKSPLFLFLKLFGLAACICILPAFGVVAYYQKRSQK